MTRIAVAAITIALLIALAICPGDAVTLIFFSAVGAIWLVITAGCIRRFFD